MPRNEKSEWTSSTAVNGDSCGQINKLAQTQGGTDSRRLSHATRCKHGVRYSHAKVSTEYRS
eukprot:6185997-Pleurochrysis_carterae.AAC.1